MTALPMTAPSRLWTDAPALMPLAAIIALAAIPLAIATGLDPRQFQGESIWAKPLKFHAALVIYLVTLAFFARYLPPALQQSRRWRAYIGFVSFAIIAELLWIGAAATLGTASHFNASSPIWSGLYTLMGIAAVSLTSLSLAMGALILRNPATGLTAAMQLAIALGLIITFILTVITAGTMSSGTGHLVGTAITGDRLPLIGWSREVGDLRAPHFFATHALHAIPLAGFTGSRALVIAAAAAYTAFVLGTFAISLSGTPLI
jgi:hypothetical protein